MRYIALLVSLLVTACAETFTAPATEPPAKPGEPRQVTGDDLDGARKAYYQALENGTKRVRVHYDRVDTAAIYWATLDTDALRAFRHDALAIHELWSPEQRESEASQANAEAAKFLTFSLVLYTEDQKDNVLSRADDSPIKVYLLQPDGKRDLPAEIHKLDSPKSRVEWLYPHKDRFSTVWILKFPRPSTQGTAELQVTGTHFASATRWDIGGAAISGKPTQ